jgi:hypothetical protein
VCKACRVVFITCDVSQTFAVSCSSPPVLARLMAPIAAAFQTTYTKACRSPAIRSRPFACFGSFVRRCAHRTPCRQRLSFRATAASNPLAEPPPPPPPFFFFFSSHNTGAIILVYWYTPAATTCSAVLSGVLEAYPPLGTTPGVLGGELVAGYGLFFGGLRPVLTGSVLLLELVDSELAPSQSSLISGFLAFAIVLRSGWC